MSDYSSLKATINANVKANNNHEITGSIMNSVLNAMVNSLGAGYQFIGVATPTNPGSAQTPDYKCFYIATTPGTYTNLGGLVVADGEVAILKYDTSWTKEVTGIATAESVSQLGQKLIEGDTKLGIFYLGTQQLDNAALNLGVFNRQEEGTLRVYYNPPENTRKHICVKVNPGDVVTIGNNVPNKDTVFFLLSQYSYDGEVTFASISDTQHNRYVVRNSSITVTLPNDCYYIAFNLETDILPTIVSINGYDVVTLSGMLDYITYIASQRYLSNKKTINWETGVVSDVNNDAIFLTDYIPLKKNNCLLYISTETDATNKLGFALYETTKSESFIPAADFIYVPSYPSNDSAICVFVPKNANYIRLVKHTTRHTNPRVIYDELFTNIQSKEDGIPIPILKGFYLSIGNSITVGETIAITFTPFDGLGCSIVPCTSGDVFTITAKSPNKVYAFIDATNKVLAFGGGYSQTLKDVVVTAPQTSAYLLINTTIGVGISYIGSNHIGNLQFWTGAEVNFRKLDSYNPDALYNERAGRALGINDRSIVNPCLRRFVEEVNYSDDLENYLYSYINYYRTGENAVDLDHPLPTLVYFYSRDKDNNSGHLRIYEGVDTLIAEFDVTGFCGVVRVYNLQPGKTYHWVYYNSAYSNTYGSGAFTPSGHPRFVKVMDANIANRVDNVRDIGGWPVAWNKRVKYGLLFRGSDMNGDHTINADGISVMVNGLHIDYDLDLRASTESPATSSPLGNGVEWGRFPVTAYIIDGDSGQNYAGAIKQIVSNLNEGIVTYFHCAAGADRTGTLSLLILALLGVCESDLSKEYELTPNRNRNILSSETPPRGIPNLMSAIKSYNGNTLQDKVKTWANTFGITDEEIYVLQAKMTMETNE